MKYVAALMVCLAYGKATAADNLAPFVGQAWHPVCGMNSAFDGKPKNIPTPPFNACRTLAVGYQANNSYTEAGIDALSKFIVAMGNAGTWEQRFAELSPPLKCRPAMPLGFGQPGGNLPICTVEFVSGFLSSFRATPTIADFIALEKTIKGLDLSNQATIEKLKQATVVVRATGQTITFKDMTELLN